MRFILAVLLVSLPILDIITLIRVGSWIGAWPTIGLVLLSAAVGLALLRSQGLAILAQARKTLAAGIFPAREVFDGACILVGGALLLLPGFASDLLSLVFLLPAARSLLRRFVTARISRFGHSKAWTVDQPQTRKSTTDIVIEGEYETVEPAHRQEQTTSGDGVQRPHSPWRR
jgi:UPF0716 protein FxsA